jgi:hypothetical protein
MAGYFSRWTGSNSLPPPRHEREAQQRCPSWASEEVPAACTGGGRQRTQQAVLGLLRRPKYPVSRFLSAPRVGLDRNLRQSG